MELSDIPIIAEGQIRIEEEAAQSANKILFCDTDVLITKVYSEHYYNTCPDWIKEAAYNPNYALHLFPYIDTPWVEDKLRDRGDRKEEMFALFKSELEKAKRPYRLITGNFEEISKSSGNHKTRNSHGRTMKEKIKITEVGPRDGLQNESKVISTEDKSRFINLLIDAGLKNIEATSFVKADKIPQLSDATELDRKSVV